jgi:hypothetical protein
MICAKCKQEEEEFYNGDKTCKGCRREYARQKYEQNMQNPEWVAKERKRTRERNIRLGYWQKYKENRTREQQNRVNEYRYRFRRNNPDKARAHQMVGRAIKNGKLKKEPCVICGATTAEAHHDDYSKPLEVIWLCRKHHAEIHYLKDEK